MTRRQTSLFAAWLLILMAACGSPPTGTPAPAADAPDAAPAVLADGTAPDAEPRADVVECSLLAIQKGDHRCQTPGDICLEGASCCVCWAGGQGPGPRVSGVSSPRISCIPGLLSKCPLILNHTRQPF